jgi:hypothetical protein
MTTRPVSLSQLHSLSKNGDRHCMIVDTLRNEIKRERHAKQNRKEGEKRMILS